MVTHCLERLLIIQLVIEDTKIWLALVILGSQKWILGCNWSICSKEIIRNKLFSIPYVNLKIDTYNLYLYKETSPFSIHRCCAIWYTLKTPSYAFVQTTVSNNCLGLILHCVIDVSQLRKISLIYLTRYAAYDLRYYKSSLAMKNEYRSVLATVV